MSTRRTINRRVRHTLLAEAVRAAMIGFALMTTAQAAPPVIALSDLNGSNGFRLDGADADDFSGSSVSSAGDVNGDGIDDLIIGSYGSDPNGLQAAGSSYIVFGRRSAFATPIALASLNGSDGFRVNGAAANERSGGAVSAAGDVNGDGIDDLMVGAAGADPNGLQDAGSSYVVFGRSAGFGPTVDLDSLTGGDGYRLDGAERFDSSGSSLSNAGDVNGDGIGDLIVGAADAAPNGVQDAGSVYVVFGRSDAITAPVALSALNGSNGFRIDGAAATDYAGRAVATAGDVNGDGIDDLIVGAPYADPNGNLYAGSSYVVFGRNGGFSTPVALSSLSASEGYRIDGAAADDQSGYSVGAAGDLNGDGFDDLLIGAPNAQGNGLLSSGSSYVVLGSSAAITAPVALTSLDGTNGFRIDGAAVGDESGSSVSGAGDVNGDGIEDLILAAPKAGPNALTLAGSVFVLYGRNDGFITPFALNSLDGSNGFRLDGAAMFDRAGNSVSAAGDVNSDGVSDMIVGTFSADPNGFDSGSSYVIYGARDRVFRDGIEDLNIDTYSPRLDVRQNAIGSAVRWQNAATCNCDRPPFDFNLKALAGGDLAFSWPAGGSNGGVSDGSAYSVLQVGAVIGPSSTFSNSGTVMSAANWRAGAIGFIGFRFVNANTGLVNYGFAQLQTTAPTGFPAKVIRFGVNLTGLAVTIPPP